MLTLLIDVLVLGLVLWLINALPIPSPFKEIAYVIFVVIVIIWVLGFLR